MTDVMLSVLLPVRNEGINLRLMLKMLHGMVEVPNEVLVICDDPADDSLPWSIESRASIRIFTAF